MMNVQGRQTLKAWCAYMPLFVFVLVVDVINIIIIGLREIRLEKEDAYIVCRHTTTRARGQTHPRLFVKRFYT